MSTFITSRSKVNEFYQYHLHHQTIAAKLMNQSVFRCTVCELDCRSEFSLAEHVRGRLHRKNLDHRRAAACNVFVRGFPKHLTITSKILTDTFSQYGQVEKVFVQDVYAIVTFSNESSATAALGNPPIIEGKPLIVKPRDYKVFSKRPPTKPMLMDQGSARPILPISAEAMELLLNAQTLNEQVELLSSHAAMTDTTLTRILSLIKELEAPLSVLFPDSLLLLFGSFVTGLGTTTSDADITLLTRPLYTHLLTPHLYYPPRFLELSRQSPVSPPSPTESVGSACSTPERPISCEQDALKAVTKLVRSTPGCERVFTIKNARCPIVRFYHRPSTLHVDLSLDNNQGVHNSRLLQAYCRFDPRVTPVVRAVRVWMREATQRRINSYATSLMVLACLQVTQPPVLPCLQDLGPWPRNMDWFKQHKPSEHVTFEPWSCDFTPIESLKPSTNTSSVGTLFVQFFRHYSQFPFSREIIAIHYRGATSVQEANRKLSHPMVVSSDLVVQDPFDHSHNVCKNISKSIFSQLTARLAHALQLLKEKPPSSVGSSPLLLEIFSSGPLHLSTYTKTVVLTVDTVIKLWRQVGCPLASTVADLDLTNEITLNYLNRVIGHSLIKLLAEKYSFECEPIKTTETEDHVPLSRDVPTPKDNVLCSTNSRLEGGDHELSSRGEESDCELTRVEPRKRRLSDSPTPVDKRAKSSPQTIKPIDLLISIAAELPNPLYQCTAYSTTWMNRRQRRQVNSDLQSMEGLEQSLPRSMLLQMVVGVVRDEECVAKITISCESQFKVHFDNWFSVFKKFLLNL